MFVDNYGSLRTLTHICTTIDITKTYTIRQVIVMKRMMTSEDDNQLILSTIQINTMATLGLANCESRLIINVMNDSAIQRVVDSSMY